MVSRAAVQGVSETARNYLLIGNQFTSQVAEDSLSSPGHNVTKVWDVTWFPSTAAASKTADMMTTLMAQLNYATVILQPLDDTIFLQRSAEGCTSIPME